jgi:protein involved in polysaccharide export with SLBB domain
VVPAQPPDDAPKEEAGDDPVLRDGDRLMVPTAEGVLLVGRVRAPGIYPVPGGSVKISRLIIGAGGFDLHAKKTSVSVIRKDKPGEIVKVDLKAVLEDGRLEKDITVFPGDIVFVSESVF